MNSKRHSRIPLHFASIFHVLGLIMGCVSLSLLLPMITAWLMQEPRAFRAFGLTMLCALTLGAGLYFPFKARFSAYHLRHREACFIVTLAWASIAGIGALPYLFSGVFASANASWLYQISNSYFESVSGLTTTGSTILTNIEALPRSLLLWRAESHWLGGMGIILLTIAILPLLGVGGMQLFKAEVPGVSVDKISPRISETAKTLWVLYLGLSLAEFVLLLLGQMSVYDALCHTFATLSTGGFSTKNLSIEHYESRYIEAVITGFMFLGGVNFIVLYKLAQGRFKQSWRDLELRLYLLITAAVSVLVAVNLWGQGLYNSLPEALRYSGFQVVSIMTTTGFSSANWEQWPVFSQALLVSLMFTGGMAGSTSGGTKLVRLIILLKYAYRELQTLIHPRAIISIKLQGQIISREVIRSVLAFFTIFSLLLIAGTLSLTALNLDLLTAFSASLTALSNVGPGLSTVGAVDNFNHLPLLAKWILIVLMLLGRLEIYTAFVLLMPEFWKK